MKDAEILVCDCSSLEHQIVIRVEEEEGYKMIYLGVLLARFKFFKRLILGIKYILGYKCRYGDFEEFIFTPHHLPQLKKLVKELETTL